MRKNVYTLNVVRVVDGWDFHVSVGLTSAHERLPNEFSISTTGTDRVDKRVSCPLFSQYRRTELSIFFNQEIG